MKHLGWIIIMLAFISCAQNKTEEQNVQTTDTTSVKKIYFPVSSFLKGQMRLFDSMLVTPLHTITVQGKTDSLWIKREDLKPALQTFLNPDISDSFLRHNFSETKFNDQTLNAITFMYSPISVNDSVPIEICNVYVNPQSGKVNKIFIEKKITKENTTLVQQLTWQTDRYAQIITVLDKPDGKTEILKSEKFTWNFNQ